MPTWTRDEHLKFDIAFALKKVKRLSGRAGEGEGLSWAA